MRRALALLLSTIVPGACVEATEGERLGLYSVLATRTTNTCGAQLSGKLPSARFNVALSLQRGVLRWTPQGTEGATGSFDVYQGTFRIAVEASTLRIAPDRRREIVGCVLRRVDLIEGSVTMSADGGVGSNDASSNIDAGTVIGGFRAQETIAYGTESGDCTPLIGVGEGQAFALPCQVGYQLEATRIGP